MADPARWLIYGTLAAGASGVSVLQTEGVSTIPVSWALIFLVILIGTVIVSVAAEKWRESEINKSRRELSQDLKQELAETKRTIHELRLELRHAQITNNEILASNSALEAHLAVATDALGDREEEITKLKQQLGLDD